MKDDESTRTGPAVEERLLQTMPEGAEVEIPRAISSAQAAFRRDLPKLLTERQGEWVAYSGDRCLGFGPTKTELYQDCLAQGFRRGEFLVELIEPEPPAEAELFLDS